MRLLLHLLLLGLLGFIVDGFELVAHLVLMENGDLVTEMGTVLVPEHQVVTLVTKVELLLTTNLALG